MTSPAVVEQVAALRARLLEPGNVQQLRITALRDDLIVIALLQVPKPLRRNGIGTQTLCELTAAADRHGWILAGTPDTSFGSSRAGLDRLYRRFGFTSNHGRHADFTISESLVRTPQRMSTTSTSSDRGPSTDLDRAEAQQVSRRRDPSRPDPAPNMTVRLRAPRR
ncbi:hypothetical protein HJ588_15575 [Flexivirga sp. ID2601S]|uniref:Uncharacterized protein n=1 Tax=Flexivirga aerilata TaxID=1656889 RepID=A0A849AJU9_9MICO|nr:MULTISPECIES: hypothetical protein [Flexivirga]NNG40685.1 hypothetical protein [Flexivirga aerilata]